MSQDYYSNNSTRETKNRRSLWMWLLDQIIFLISAVASIAVLLALITPYIDPTVSWIFPVVAIAAPAIYLSAILCALYWVIRWRLVYALTMIFMLLLCAGRLSLYVKLDSKKHYGVSSTRGTVKLMSYNVKGFLNDNKNLSTSRINQYIDSLRPDIVCLQEYAPSRANNPEVESTVMNKYYSAVVGAQAIFSRYKIIKTSEEFFTDDESGSSFWADLVIGSDTIRIINNHLHSTSIKADDNHYLSSMDFVADTMRSDKLKDIVIRLHETSSKRVHQADSIATIIEESPHKVIVCGDFNDTPNSYVYRTIAYGLQDAFQEVGAGYCYTYRGFMNLMRIDYILVSEPIEILKYWVDPHMVESDHLPLTTVLRIN